MLPFSQQSFDYSQDSVCTDYCGGIEPLVPPSPEPKKRRRARLLSGRNDENDSAFNIHSTDDNSGLSQPLSQDINERFQCLTFKASQDNSLDSTFSDSSSKMPGRGLFGDDSNEAPGPQELTRQPSLPSRPPLRGRGVMPGNTNSSGASSETPHYTKTRLPTAIENPFLPRGPVNDVARRRRTTVVLIPPSMPSRFAMDYDSPEIIGQGHSSQVFRARSRLDGAVYAIKRIKERFEGEKRRHLLLREVCAFAALSDCPFLVKYRNCWVEEQLLYIATEYCHGGNLERFITPSSSSSARQQVPMFAEDVAAASVKDVRSGLEPPVSLFSHVKAVQESATSSSSSFIPQETKEYTGNNEGIDEPFAWRVLYCISCALAYMHGRRIVHLDVRPANIFQSENVVKLGDLGNACLIDTRDDIPEGEDRYIPRELVDSDGNEVDLAKADVFALGASVYELCLGRPIAAMGEEWHAIRDGNLCEEILGKYSQDLSHVLRQMLASVPATRLSATQVCKLSAAQILRATIQPSDLWSSVDPSSDDLQSWIMRNLIEQAGLLG